VQDGHTGFLVPHGDTAAMAAAMRRVGSSRELVTQLGAQARVFAETFTWGRATDQTEAHLLRVIAGGRAA
jgi:glycosyltransferase involved in cell wall biosynthesis